MRLVVDGVFFQLNSTGIARVWVSILTILGRRDDMEIFLLDRGDAPHVKGITNVPFPSYKPVSSAADSALIQAVCDHLGADVFTSTYYTSPLTTPMVLMVYDMIPEIFEFDMSARFWMEKETAISYAQRYLCISHSTKNDLLRFYPEIGSDIAGVAHCGVDTGVFRQRPAKEIAAFRKTHGLTRPYFLFVGSRVQTKSYKNSDLYFNALREMAQVDFDVLCVGGEETIEPSVLDNLPPGAQALRVQLSDHDLSLAYGGAIALVYPSLYEGFGMPVIEAMASGCPVITTHHGSLAEAAGDAAHLIEGHSVSEMADALNHLRDKGVQDDLRARGLTHAAQFSWEPMAERMDGLFQQVIAAARTEQSRAFFAGWKKVRALQADVDYL